MESKRDPPIWPLQDARFKPAQDNSPWTKISTSSRMQFCIVTTAATNYTLILNDVLEDSEILARLFGPTADSRIITRVRDLYDLLAYFYGGFKSFEEASEKLKKPDEVNDDQVELREVLAKYKEALQTAEKEFSKQVSSTPSDLTTTSALELLIYLKWATTRDTKENADRSLSKCLSLHKSFT